MKPPNLENDPCIFLSPEVSSLISDRYLVCTQIDSAMTMFDKGGLTEKQVYFIQSPYEMVNCTIKHFSGQWNIGKKLSSGSYDGMIGMMVRGEANSTALAYVIGSTEDEPVSIGPVWTTTEMSLLSGTPKANVAMFGAEGWLKNFKVIVYQYLVLAMFIFIITYVMLSKYYQVMRRIERILNRIIILGVIKRKSKADKMKCKRMNIKKIIISTIDIAYKSLTSLIQPQSYQVQAIQHNYIVFSFVTGIFFLMSGYFLNLTSTDMIAIQPVPIIDSLDDLLTNEHFSHVDVGITDGLWQVSILESSIPNSLEGRLWKRVKYKIPIQFDNMATLSDGWMPMVDKMYGMKVALAVDKIIIEAMKAGICQLNDTEHGSTLHIARGNTFAEKLLTFAISKTSSGALVRWINYRQQLLLQSGLTGHFSESIIYDLKMDPGVTLTSIINCLKHEKNDHEVPKSTDILFLYSTFITVLLLFIIGFFILLFEKLISMVQKVVNQILQ